MELLLIINTREDQAQRVSRQAFENRNIKNQWEFSKNSFKHWSGEGGGAESGRR